jgi:hypothetical protein
MMQKEGINEEVNVKTIENTRYFYCWQHTRIFIYSDQDIKNWKL